MPPALKEKAAKDGVFGMTGTEVRLLLFAHLCNDKESGKIEFDKLATRTNVSTSSATTMFRRAVQKLTRLHGEEEATDAREDAGTSTVPASPASLASPASPAETPTRRRGGRKPKTAKKAAEKAAAAEKPVEAAEAEAKPKSEDQEIDMKDLDEEIEAAEAEDVFSEQRQSTRTDSQHVQCHLCQLAEHCLGLTLAGLQDHLNSHVARET